MQSYYIDKSLEENLILNNEVFHYLCNVIRIQKKEQIILFNENQRAIYEIKNIDKNSKTLSVLKIKDMDVKRDKYSLDIALGLLKKDKVETVIQKTTELGVNNIYLLNLKNNVMKITQDKKEKKIKRYKEIAKSASEQSKRFSLVDIFYLDDKNMIDFPKYDYAYLLYEKEEGNLLFEQLLKIQNVENKKILLIIGPEGGFSQDELDYFEKNTKKVSINDNILRAETAAIVGVGIVKALLE